MGKTSSKDLIFIKDSLFLQENKWKKIPKKQQQNFVDNSGVLLKKLPLCDCSMTQFLSNKSKLFVSMAKAFKEIKSTNYDYKRRHFDL